MLFVPFNTGLLVDAMTGVEFTPPVSVTAPQFAVPPAAVVVVAIRLPAVPFTIAETSTVVSTSSIARADALAVEQLCVIP